MIPAPADEIRALFAPISCPHIVDTFVEPSQITRRVNIRELEAYLARRGWRIIRRDGNVYGYLKVEPIPETAKPASKLRMITRDDHQAAYMQGVA